MSSTCTSAGFGRRSTEGSTARSCTRCAGSAIGSAPMNRILSSTSLRLALGYATLFVLSSLTLVGFLWWQTAEYLDREINAVIIADTRAIGDRMRDFGLS